MGLYHTFNSLQAPFFPDGTEYAMLRAAENTRDESEGNA